MKKFESLTKYIPEIERWSFGSWKTDTENDESDEHPIQMPDVSFSKAINDFIRDIEQFSNDNPDLKLNDYYGILRKNNIKWGLESMKAVDPAKLDAPAILALLTGAAHADQFCKGALLNFFKSGCILKWLERLKEIDDRNKNLQCQDK